MSSVVLGVHTVLILRFFRLINYINVMNAVSANVYYPNVHLNKLLFLLYTDCSLNNEAVN